MASVLRFQDMTPSLTPPPSDRGECEDAAMLQADAYLPEVFYPSPAPSFSQRCAFGRHSPDMEHSDTTCDAEEDSRQMFLLTAPEPQIFPHTTTMEESTLYSTTMSYQPFESNPWVTYGGYHNGPSMFSYTSEEPPNMYPTYVSEAPCHMMPPNPQGVTGSSYNFSEPISHPLDSSELLGVNSNQSGHRQFSRAPSTMSVSAMSSRSCSPSLQQDSRHRRRTSSIPQRSMSSSLHSFGIPIRTPNSTSVQAWRCAYPSCTSRAVFTRGCDLRKHYNRHSKHLFCRVDGCPQSESACIAVAQQQAIQTGADASDLSKLPVTGGFSSKKDRARHEAKHNPGIKCEWKGQHDEECGRLFSRMDNMKDHVRRIHNKGQTPSRKSSVQ